MAIQEERKKAGKKEKECHPIRIGSMIHSKQLSDGIGQGEVNSLVPDPGAFHQISTQAICNMA